MGRRTKYDPDFARQARYLSEELGATNEQIAKVLNCSTSTLWHWRRAHEEFSSAIDEGKASYDQKNVEAAIVDCAVGYEIDEYVYHQGKEDFVRLPKYHPPDPKSQLLWMHNRAGWSLPTRTIQQQALVAGQEVVDHPGYEALARQLMEERYKTRMNLPGEVETDSDS